MKIEIAAGDLRQIIEGDMARDFKQNLCYAHDVKIILLIILTYCLLCCD